MDWLVYQNQGATRNRPISEELVSALSFLPEMGITMKVVSGGQGSADEGGPRTGSTRHDHGQSADVDFYMGDRKLDWNNPEDIPVLQQIVATGKARGVTGWGAGNDYMGPGRMHVGFGAPAVWGAGGKSDNAPDWLVAAYNEAPEGSVPANAPPAPNTEAGTPQQVAATTAPQERKKGPLEMLAENMLAQRMQDQPSIINIRRPRNMLRFT